MFTLPQVQAWTPDDITAHAAHWSDLADKRREVSGAVVGDAADLPWAGSGDDGMRTAAGDHHSKATGQADLLQQAAKAAQNAASIGTGQQKAIMNQVQQAAQQDFAITPTWEAVDTKYSPGTIEWAARQPGAAQISASLTAAVAQFTEHDVDTGMTLARHAVTLGGGDVTGHVAMAGHGFKTDGAGMPVPPVIPRPDGSLPMPTLEHPGAIINNHGGQTPVLPDPRDHNGSTRDIVDGFGKVAIGIGTEAAGVVAAPATGGASLIGTVPGGALPIFDGLDDLSHLTNLGRLPSAPPVWPDGAP
jgi:hypothetical protein